MASKQNIIYVYFKGKHLTISKSQYQYNHGQFLYFADLDLPQTFEVHFSNRDRGESKPQIGSNKLVEIPDEYFWSGALQIYAWIYLHSGADDGETVYEVKIPLMKRAKPTDEEPLPQQQGVIDRAIAELNNAIEITTENANKTNADKTIVNNIKDEVVVLKDEIDSTATTINQKAQEAIAASERAETSAQNAATSENKALNYSQQAEQSAQSALESKNVAQQKAEVATNASSEALGYRNEALEAKNQAVQAKQNIVDYRNETKEYRDETLNLKNNVQTLKNQIDETAEEIKDISDTVKEDAQSASQSASSASQSSTNASESASQAGQFADGAEQSANQAEQSMNMTEDYKNQSETYKNQSETFKNQAEQFKNQSETNVSHYPKIVNDYWYVWDATNGEYINTNVDANGIKGDKGNGIQSAILNNDYTLTLTFTDGTTYTTPSIRGEKGEQGEPATDMDIHICSTSEYDSETRIPTIANPDDKTFYLVPTEDGTSPDLFTEWVYVNNAWEMFGSASVDLSGYLTDVQVNGTSVVTDGVANITNLKYVKDDPTDGGGVIEGHISANSASGAYSHSEGDGTTASAPCSHAEGRETNANAFYAHAEGYQTTVTSVCGHAEGTGNTVSGDSAHAEGNNTTASERWAHAEGGGTTASGECSHAEGAGTRATGGQAHSEGGGTLASGNQAHAEGASTTASGDNSHAEGLSTTASGACSHASGVATIAQRKSQMAIGEYNVADTGGSTTSDKGNYILIAGNGTIDSNRSNAMTLDWSGNEKLAGSLTLGMNTQDETTISASELKGLKEMSPVDDVQINGTSIVQDGVANVPIASANNVGLVKILSANGVYIDNNNDLAINKATDSQIKNGSASFRPIVPANQSNATFYGLAKAAGDTTQSASSNAVGNYTNEAKSSIQNMLGITDKYTPKEWIAESETELVTNAHSVGDLFYIGETLYKVIADLNAGDAINVGVNVEEVDVNNILTDYATKEDVENNVSIVEKSASGAVASFTDGADNIPLKSLVVNIDPVQDLHGQDSPYPAGGGANKWDEEWETGRIGWLGQDADDPDKIRSKGFIPVSEGSVYRVVTSNNLQFFYYDSNKSFVSYESSSKADQSTITIPTGCAYIRFYTYGTSYGGTYKNDIAINYPSTVTTYAPYENICPISGWTSVGVNQFAVNVWDEEWELASVNWNTNVFSPAPNGGRLSPKNYIPVVEGATYYINKYAGNFIVGYSSIGSNGIAISSTYGIFTIPDGIHYIKFGMAVSDYGTTYSHDISINYPSTDHDYHPYTGRSITISLGQTVYGGKLDVLSGELVIDRAKVVVNGNSNIFGWTTPIHPLYGFALNPLPRPDRSRGEVMCDKLSSRIGVYPWNVYRVNGTLYFCINDEVLSEPSLTGAKMWLADNPLTVVYPLAEPIEIQLFPNQVNSLLGVNNIWADSGDTEVEYFSQVDKDLIDYIETSLKPYVKEERLNDYVSDVQIDGNSIVENNVANVPIATQNVIGALYTASEADGKVGTHTYRAIVPKVQHSSVFYGLAKAAGVDMASSSNAVGTYTDEAKTAIKTMLGIHDTIDSFVEEVTGTDVTITGQPSYRYNCGELYSLTVTPPSSGTIDIRFTSGSTPTVLTLPSTIKMPEWWVEVEANTIYEMCITDGIYCGVMTWAMI